VRECIPLAHTVARRRIRCFNRQVHARRIRPADQPRRLDTDPRSAPAPPERPALWLQRAAGNHAAAGVLTRQPDTHDKPTPKNAPAPGEAQAKKLAALLPGKRADVLTELGKEGTDLQSVDDAAAAIAGATKVAKERDAMLLLRRCIAFVRHRPKAPSNKAGPSVRKGGEGVVKLDAKVDGGEIKVRTGVEADLGRPTFSLTYSGAHAEDCHWLQFIWREIVPQHAAASGGGMVDDTPVAGKVERTAGFSYKLTTKDEAPEWNTDTADKKTAFYEEETGAVRRGDKEVAMFDDPDPRDNLLTDAFKGGSLPAHAVSRAHFDTYLVRGMDVLYRVRLDLSWQITNGKADAAPQIDQHGEAIKGIRTAQLAKLKEQLGGKAEVPDYLATAEEKPAAKQPASKPTVQRDGAFAPVKDLSKGSLPAAEWDPKTRTKGLAYPELLADIATLAGAGQIEGVPGTATSDINPLAKKDPALIKPGLNFVSSLPGADGETGFINSAGEYKGPALPLDGGTPKVAIMVAGTAFEHDKAHALATIRHEMKHATHCLLAIHALERWRGDTTKKMTFDKWLEKHEREPNLTLIRERVRGTLPNTELLAYSEGLATSFQFIPQTPDSKLMMPGKYPSAIFELIKAGQEDVNASPHVSKAADERLRDYCQNVLTAAQRSALVAWIDFLSAYITAKDVPKEHKDADKSWAKVIKDDVRTIAPFLKRLREIALKPDAKK
jgi:hypothetical protein